MVLLFCVFMFFAYHAFKYRNPYKLYMCFGRKGSGKTTLMTKLALQYQKKGWNVFCDREIPGCIQFETEDFGRYQFPPNSLILVDEVGLVWDNRNFKNFPEHVKVYFKYQRQYQHVVYLFSQSFDIDKKIRDLTDHLYIVQNFFNCFSIARRVTKSLTVVHADKSSQGESKIVDDYNIDSLLFAPSAQSALHTYQNMQNISKALTLPSSHPLRVPPPGLPALSKRQTLVGAAKERQEMLRFWKKH